MANDFGYAGKILRVNLSSGGKTDIATSEYADRFLGGRGIGAKICWDEVSPEIGALDPGNRLAFVTGPLTGIPGLASSRLAICGKTPETTPNHFCYASLGGSWGVHLKFAGYDGIIVQGKSDKPVYLFLHGDVCEIRDASHLWGKGTFQVQEELRGELGEAIDVITIGPAGDNMVVFATLLAGGDAVGGGGLGAVMGSKGLKAIAISGNKKIRVANPEKLRELAQRIREFKMGSTKQPRKAPVDPRMKWEDCWGCIGCSRATYEADNGQRGKFICQARGVYQSAARKYYGKSNDVPFQATKLCDSYGLDTKAISLLLTWLSRCQQAGILTEKNMGLPMSELGSLEFIETLLHKISLRDGFGDILAQGIVKAANLIGNGAAEQMADIPMKAGNKASYDPRMYFTTGLLYMVEPRQPVSLLHEIRKPVVEWLRWISGEKGAYLSSDVIYLIARKFWGSELAADFSTYEGKALAAKAIQDREYVKECLVLCDSFWPIMHVEYSEDHVGDSSLESQLFSAVTGMELDENELYRVGERVFNLQRAILIREGHQGREDDKLPEPFYTMPLESDSGNTECMVPAKKGQIITKKGAVLDREKFETLKDEYYALRGWDVATGRQTKAKLEELDLRDISDGLQRRGFVEVGWI